MTARTDAATEGRYIELRADGLTMAAASASVGIAMSTAEVLESRARDEIARIRCAALRTLYERYGMTREKRIELVGEELLEVERVLETRRGTDLEQDMYGATPENDECFALNPERRVPIVSKTSRKIQGVSLEESEARGVYVVRGDRGYYGLSTERLLDLKIKLMHELERFYIELPDGL